MRKSIDKKFFEEILLERDRRRSNYSEEELMVLDRGNEDLLNIFWMVDEKTNIFRW